LARRAQVDFSLPTFIDGASLMIRDDGPRDLAALAGKKVGVLAGTTTEEGLRANLKSAAVTAEIVPVTTHSEGLKMLDDGEIAAYFADRAILLFLAAQSGAPKRLRLADLYLTVEPYALALPRGDDDFRLAVDRALSHIYRSGEIAGVFDSSFDAKIEPTGLLKTLYLISGLPD
jgi:polar amino acid transport system substrate-binding protein/glutamate/aspartate transport system substrate-binding protein